MSLEDFSDSVAAARQRFEEELIRAGFLEDSGGWVGTVTSSVGSIELRVTLPFGFPFKPARVIPIEIDSLPWSWHRERDGALCLVADDDHDNLWWADAGAFLDHVKAWLERSSSGWIGDRPDLDLDRYFEPSSTDRRLYVFGDLNPVIGRLVRFEPTSNDVMRLAGQGTKPPDARRHTKRLYGIVVDLGVVVAPPRSWADISGLVDASYRLDSRIHDRSVNVVVTMYQRGAQQGVVILEVWPNAMGGISAFRLLAGADTDAAKAARSGPDAALVKGMSVAIVGAGAIGSFVVDGLARGGVDSMILIDGDRLMPGNVVRHLVDAGGVGLPKAVAVKRNVERRFPGLVSIQAIQRDLVEADDAVDLLQSNDLVINATADFSVTALLVAAAKSTGSHLLSVVLQNQGQTYRVDVLPPLGASGALAPSTRQEADSESQYFDSGCGSPISPTPPSAVIEAASAAVRHAFGLLLSRPISDAGETRDLDLGSNTAKAAS